MNTKYVGCPGFCCEPLHGTRSPFRRSPWTFSVFFLITALGIGLFGLAELRAGPQDRPDSSITYTLSEQLKPDPVCNVTIHGTGCANLPRPLRVKLETWGSWSALDGYYLRGLTSQPPLAPDTEHSGEFVVQTPPNWGGALEISYTIPLLPVGSRLHD